MLRPAASATAVASHLGDGGSGGTRWLLRKICLCVHAPPASHSDCAGSFTKYTGSVHCLLETVRHEGFTGLYRGMAAPLLGTVFETSTLFFINGWLKRELSEAGHLAPGEELPMRLVWLAGAGTGLAVSFVLTPIELIKCRLQVTSPTLPRYTGPLDCLRRSLAAEGYSVLYRGLFGTMLREVPGTAAWFAAYESFVRAMTPAGTRREDLPSLTIITAGALGGIAYWCIMYPADTVKALQQIADTGVPVGGAPGAPRVAPMSFLATGMYVYRTSGMRGLFAGFVPTVLRAAPSNAAIFYVYEEVSRAMKAAQQRALM